VNDSVVESIRQAIRFEVKKEYKEREIEVTRLVLGKLIHDCRIEITPSRREESVLFTKKNKNEK
jgi:hypothetical protein